MSIDTPNALALAADAVGQRIARLCDELDAVVVVTQEEP